MRAASKHAEKIFSLAAGVAAALAPRQGANADRGEKPHQGIFYENCSLRVSSECVKWSGTHQVSECCASEIALGPTVYLYDGMDANSDIVEEVDNSGNALARYTQDDRIDEPLSMLRSGAASYYERDGLGSVTSLSNSSGALTNTYTYDSFGKLTASTGTITNPFQYASREFDQETGLYYNRARYYDEGVGRFVSEDPARFGGGIDFYRYTHNNPINRTDPDGLGAAECMKALANWAIANVNVENRLQAFTRYGDGTQDMLRP